MNEQLQKAIDNWETIAPLVQRPDSENDYDSLVHHLDEAMDIAGSNFGSPLNGLIESMAHAAQQYEEKFISHDVGSGITALKYLMKVHKIKQSDLKEVGSQGVVSEILNGKRSLTVRHIRALARRFSVSPNTFLEP